MSRLSLPPFFLCLGLSTLIGSGAICATGVFYGMQMVGKKWVAAVLLLDNETRLSDICDMLAIIILGVAEAG